MTVKCPNNDKHKKFITTAHIMQEWIVDENGNFIEVYNECLETTHSPNIDNIWQCLECNAKGIQV